MRKGLTILALTVVTLLASSGDAFAQRRGGGRGYGGGSSWGISIGDGGARFYSGNNYGRGGYYSPYYGSRYYSVPYYSGSNYYYYDAAPIIQQSYYAEPAPAQQVATMVVLLPRADAKVWFDNSPTTQQGMERTFNSPPLDPGGPYSYTIRARWTENGQSIERERRVSVRSGQLVNVNFRTDSGETLQTPPRP